MFSGGEGRGGAASSNPAYSHGRACPGDKCGHTLLYKLGYWAEDGSYVFKPFVIRRKPKKVPPTTSNNGIIKTGEAVAGETETYEYECGICNMVVQEKDTLSYAPNTVK
jgi:hypothetical protein